MVVGVAMFQNLALFSRRVYNHNDDDDDDDENERLHKFLFHSFSRVLAWPIGRDAKLVLSVWHAYIRRCGSCLSLGF